MQYNEDMGAELQFEYVAGTVSGLSFRLHGGLDLVHGHPSERWEASSDLD